MSDYFDPYDADRPMRLGCSCGAHASPGEHAAAELRSRSESADFEAYSNQFIEATLMKALFPQDAVRRNFLRAVGRRTAMAAIGSVLPIASLQAMAQDKGALGEEGPEDRLHPDHLRHAADHGATRWASTASRG